MDVGDHIPADGDSPIDPETADLLAGLRAQSDQALGSIVEVARLMSSYYLALVEQGLPPEFALSLTLGYQEVCFMPPRPPE